MRDERKLRVTDRRYVFVFLTLRSHRSLFDKNPEVAAESPTCAVLELASGKAARHRSKRRGGDLGRRSPFFASPDAFATAHDAGDARVEALLVSERCLEAARGATPPAVVTRLSKRRFLFGSHAQRHPRLCLLRLRARVSHLLGDHVRGERQRHVPDPDALRVPG